MTMESLEDRGEPLETPVIVSMNHSLEDGYLLRSHVNREIVKSVTNQALEAAHAIIDKCPTPLVPAKLEEGLDIELSCWSANSVAVCARLSKSMSIQACLAGILIQEAGSIQQ